VPVVSVSLDSEVYTRLAMLAKEKGLSIGGYVKELILEHLKGSTPGAGQAGLEFEARISSLEAKLRELEELRASYEQVKPVLEAKVSPQVSYEDLLNRLSELTSKLTSLEARLKVLEELEERVSNVEVEVLSLRRAVEKMSKAGVGESVKQAQAKTATTTTSKQLAQFTRRYVHTIALKELEKKGLNAESYMKGKERQGYICNDTASRIICVWREELEQAVVDLNNAKARIGELDKTLSGVRLEVARAAEKAGLLWFDAGEGKWKIHR